MKHPLATVPVTFLGRSAQMEFGDLGLVVLIENLVNAATCDAGGQH
jgi:hypothetical protein